VTALRAVDRRAGARRQAVESAVAAGTDGRPAAALGKPAFGRLPTGPPQRLGRRCATPTATWKTLRVYHSSHSLDDERCTTIHDERRRRPTSCARSTRTLHQQGPSLSPPPTSVRIRRNRCPRSSVSARPADPLSRSVASRPGPQHDRARLHDPLLQHPPLVQPELGKVHPSGSHRAGRGCEPLCIRSKQPDHFPRHIRSRHRLCPLRPSAVPGITTSQCLRLSIPRVKADAAIAESTHRRRDLARRGLADQLAPLHHPLPAHRPRRQECPTWPPSATSYEGAAGALPQIR
jgi:hypothetical protein